MPFSFKGLTMGINNFKHYISERYTDFVATDLKKWEKLTHVLFSTKSFAESLGFKVIDNYNLRSINGDFFKLSPMSRADEILLDQNIIMKIKKTCTPTKYKFIKLLETSDCIADNVARVYLHSYEDKDSSLSQHITEIGAYTDVFFSLFESAERDRIILQTMQKIFPFKTDEELENILNNIEECETLNERNTDFQEFVSTLITYTSINVLRHIFSGVGEYYNSVLSLSAYVYNQRIYKINKHLFAELSRMPYDNKLDIDTFSQIPRGSVVFDLSELEYKNISDGISTIQVSLNSTFLAIENTETKEITLHTKYYLAINLINEITKLEMLDVIVNRTNKNKNTPYSEKSG